MNITRMAIEKNRITAVALIFLVAAGIMSYLNLPQSEDPGFIIRTATVVTRFPGASPARVEQLVTDKLEKAIQEMPELDVVRSGRKPASRSFLSIFKNAISPCSPSGTSCGAKSKKRRRTCPTA